MNQTLLVLLVLFSFKHFLADFPFQTVYMLGKGKKGLDWILPLASHCLVHAGMSAIIIAVYNPAYLWLTLVEFLAHFVIDRIKATYRLPAGQWENEMRGKYLSQYYFAFGADQLAHQLTYILMIYLMSQ